MPRRVLAVSLLLGWLLPQAALAAAPLHGVLYKDPSCGCCEDYVEYLRSNGFAVDVVDTTDLASVKAKYGVREDLAGCHTFVIGGYVIEGHVPVTAIDRLLAERPKIRGIALPGMPAGSPGMSGEKAGPLVIYEIDPAARRVFAVE